MRSLATAVWAVLAILVFRPARAEDPVKPDEVRQKRLELLLARVDEFQLEVAGQEGGQLKRGAQPILRWSNPVRDFLNDGVIFLFLERSRPRAIVTVWARSPEATLQSGELWREFVSLSAQPLACSRGGRVLWSPKTGGLVEQPVAGAPAPAGKPAQRLVQMREIARRFQATSYKMESPFELRLLTQPLYRYEDEAAGILDGALFSFAEGNDPEVVLLLEAMAGAGGKEAAWRYSLARMTSYRVVVRLDGREVFSAVPYWKNPRGPSDPYFEASDGPFTLR
ncbi:MAG TPA: hypothetical protein VFB80_22820 [Pirellulaceae bacterium]|nr:hypothetical protein [Pirellulaceae bacterium]